MTETTASRRPRDRKKDKPPIWVRHVGLQGVAKLLREGKLGNALVPVTAYDLERISALPFDANLRADFRQDRSPPHHRFYWALLGHVAKATDKFEGNTEMLHRWLKLKLGLIEQITYFDGTTAMDLTSTSWASMDQLEFKVYFDRVVHLLLVDVLPGVKRRELIAPAEKMLGVRESDIWRKAA